MVVPRKNDRNSALPNRRTQDYIWVAIACLLAASLVVFVWHVSASKRVNWISLLIVSLHIGLFITLIRFHLRKGNIDIFHPIIFYFIFFVFPMIVIKGTLLAFGMESYILYLTPDSYHYLDFSLICALAGTMGLIFGFRFQFGRYVAVRLPLPRLLSIPHRLRWQPLLLVYLIGLLFALYLGNLGIFGASLSKFEGDLTWIHWLQQLSKWYLMSLFLLVLFMVRLGKEKSIWLIITGFTFTVSILLAFLSGNRSGLLWILILCIAAFQYARYPRIKPRALIPWLVGVCIVLIVGMMIITPYRTLRYEKKLYDTASLSEAASLMRESTNNLLSWNAGDIFHYTKDRIVDRFSAIEMLGLTLAFANDEGVQASERSVGMNNNIIKNVLYAFVPRIIWQNKPIVSDIGLWFSRIYCNSPYRSWSGPTVFGDLYRNFGFLGIPAGMFVLGFLLRVIYERLIIHGKSNALACLLYYFLLTDINYEGFYCFLDGWLRTIFIFLPLLWIVTRGQRRYQLLANKGHLSP